MIIHSNINLKKYNSLHIDYKASKVFEVQNIHDVYTLIFLFNYFNIEYFILGNGSKVVFKDYFIEKPIILFNKNFEYYNELENEVIVSSGTLLKDLILKLAKNNKGRFHKLYPIPASVGGAIYMNAGIKNLDISSYVNYVITINKLGKITKYNNKECNFSYRNSIFQKNKEIILLVSLKTYNLNENIILNDIKNELIYRKNIQGNYINTCGSLFKNTSYYKSYQLINKLKLNYLNINGISFSNKHSNILINDGNGTNSDVIIFINTVKYEVKKNLNIELIEELNILM